MLIQPLHKFHMQSIRPIQQLCVQRLARIKPLGRRAAHVRLSSIPLNKEHTLLQISDTASTTSVLGSLVRICSSI